jgi:hypothetical protein
VSGLTGCTVVVAVSKRGVWLAHFWEVPGFSVYRGSGFGKVRFQEEVLDFVKNGVATRWDPKEAQPPRGAKLSDHKEDLEDADIWVMSPQGEADSSKFEYEKEIGRLKQALEAEIGETKVTFHNALYEKPDDEDGEVVQLLFEYDPKPSKRVRFMFLGKPIVFDGEPGKLRG